MSRQEKAPARRLYDKIEEIRLHNGWTKVQVARLTGLNRQTLANLRKQPQPPMASTVIEIADALGIERQDALLLAGLGPDSASSTAEPDSGTAADALLERVKNNPRVMAALDRLPPDLRSMALKQAAELERRYTERAAELEKDAEEDFERFVDGLDTTAQHRRTG